MSIRREVILNAVRVLEQCSHVTLKKVQDVPEAVRLDARTVALGRFVISLTNGIWAQSLARARRAALDGGLTKESLADLQQLLDEMYQDACEQADNIEAKNRVSQRDNLDLRHTVEDAMARLDDEIAVMVHAVLTGTASADDVLEVLADVRELTSCGSVVCEPLEPGHPAMSARRLWFAFGVKYYSAINVETKYLVTEASSYDLLAAHECFMKLTDPEKNRLALVEHEEEHVMDAFVYVISSQLWGYPSNRSSQLRPHRLGVRVPSSHQRPRGPSVRSSGRCAPTRETACPERTPLGTAGLGAG